MSSGKLTTHALDLTRGRPAAGMEIELWAVRPGTEGSREKHRLKVVRTNADGRTDAPLLSGDDFTPGMYELVFRVGDFFALATADRFLDRVPIRFHITDASAHYHVPLLTTPWAYQTYRGS